MPKHVPERTCVACRCKVPKRDLVRIVRGADGTVTVDWKGKAPGRGAYIGPARECLQLALQRHALERSLSVTLTEKDREHLESELYKRRASCPYREESSMSSD
ncbi:MAG: YlxR family protein [Gammaproteobacteria bacterium]|nr:YlxR family protein [Gammaproteobacteria bacterium]